MKKLLSLMALAAIMLTFTACGSDDDPTEMIQANTSGMIVRTSMAGTTYFFSTCDLAFNINFTDKSLNLGINNVTFAPKMPKVNFEADGLKINNNDRTYFVFSGTGIQVMSGYTLNNASGQYNKNLNTLTLTYTVSSERGEYNVTTFSPTLYSKLSDGSNDYANATEKFYKFKSQLDDNNNFTASICIDNIQFVPQMPKLEEIVIPLDDATIVQTANGYTATATTIIPLFKQGDKYIPFPDRTVSNLNYTLNIKDHKFSIEFDCFGLRYTDEGYIYTTHFNPFHV